jgi:hypothetical protein
MSEIHQVVLETTTACHHWNRGSQENLTPEPAAAPWSVRIMAHRAHGFMALIMVNEHGIKVARDQEGKTYKKLSELGPWSKLATEYTVIMKP